MGEGRLLIPLMLVKGYPLEAQGRIAEALELNEAAVESARLSGNPHYLFWALFELGFALYYAGDLDAGVKACEESARVGGRMAGGTMPAGSGGPGWPLASTLFLLEDYDRGFEVLREIGGDQLEYAIPVERCFYWEMLADAELARGPAGGGRGPRAQRRGAGRAARPAPAHGGGHTRPGGGAPGRGRQPRPRRTRRRRRSRAAEAVGARLPAAYARAIRGRALAAAGERKPAIEALREAERELDECDSVRERDGLRRELRKLGARAEKRGPGRRRRTRASRPSPSASCEIAELVTDRKTNREIAAELFLSDKTVESHLRNIFVKLGASSRVEVARALERDRRERDAAEAP